MVEYRKALAINSEDIGARSNVANILLRWGRVVEAIREYETVLTYNPRYVQAYNNLGTAYLLIGDAERAARAYQKAIEVEPDYADAHYNLSRLYFQQGLETEGQTELEIYQRLIEGKKR
jgi:superkiller protein 3